MSKNSTTEIYEVSVQYSKKVIDQGAHLFWRKKMKTVFILGFLYLLATILLTATGTVDIGFGSICIGIGTILIGILYLAYRSVRSRSMSIFDEMNSKEAIWIFTSDSFSTRSDVGTSKIVWKMMAGLIVSDEIWLFLYKNGSYSVLPVANIEQPVLDFIKDRVIAVGGEIMT